MILKRIDVDGNGAVEKQERATYPADPSKEAVGLGDHCATYRVVTGCPVALLVDVRELVVVVVPVWYVGGY